MSKAAFNFIPSTSFLTKKLIEQYEIGPGDDVFGIGRFVNHEGEQRNLPSARFGNIAQMPWEPIKIGGRLQESFLVEARSIAGYNGSPVFVFLPPPPLSGTISSQAKRISKEHNRSFPGVSNKRIDIPFALGPWLLGVDHCHLHRDEPIRRKDDPEVESPDWVIRSNTGMMGVVPAWKLAEILEWPQIKPIVDQVRDQIAKTPKGQQSDYNKVKFGHFVPRPAS